MTKYRLIGDIHGDVGAYSAITTGAERSIQVGDYGIGFVENPAITCKLDLQKHRFIRGNHDSPQLCKQQPNWIEDGFYDPEIQTMFIGGALSIDIDQRTAGLNWWEDEELSVQQLNLIVDKYLNVKPQVVISHECPESISDRILPYTKFDLRSRTRDAFQVMFELHQPLLWIFGHWHHSYRETVNGTHFACLNINEYADVDLPLDWHR